MENRLSFLPLAVLLSASIFTTTACSDMAAPATPAVQKPKSGELIKIDVKLGEGAETIVGHDVTMHYTGWLYDETAPDHLGKKFDSSRDLGQPFTFIFGRGQVIEGWDQGLIGMKIGGRRTLIIPAELAYGESGAGNVIPPNAKLVFDIEFIGMR